MIENQFIQWAKQFAAVRERDIKDFLDSVGDESLYELKVLFSDLYQDQISFSFILQQEFKLVKEVHLKQYYGGSYSVSFETGQGQGMGECYGLGFEEGAGRMSDNYGFLYIYNRRETSNCFGGKGIGRYGSSSHPTNGRGVGKYGVADIVGSGSGYNHYTCGFANTNSKGNLH